MSTWPGRSYRPGRRQARSPGGTGGAGTPRRGRGRSVLRVLAFLGIGIAALGIIGGITLYVVLTGLTNPVHFDSLAETVPGARVNILVMGLDAPMNQAGQIVPDFDIHKGWRSRTDTMMLFSLDARAKEVGLISLPRDSRVLIAGREELGPDKLGHAYAYGGPDMAVATVSRVLGLPVHYYVTVNSGGVASIIDLLGGVELYVESDMHYHDPYQNLNIDLKQGLQLLDGDKAVQYMRFRKPGTDIERIRRQQRLVAALKEQVFQLGTVAKLPALVTKVADCVDTNMTAGEMLSFARMAAGLDKVTFKSDALPGTFQDFLDTIGSGLVLPYWVLDEAGCKSLVDDLAWGMDMQANAQITVEVQNGTAVPGLATQFAAELTRQGYNVVSATDAARSDYKTTEVIDRSRDSDKLRRLSQAVLRYLPDADLGRARPAIDRAQFTVILGQDYAALIASDGAGEGGPP